MTCGKCCSDAVVVDEVSYGVPIPRCWICGWRHMVPDAPPIVDVHQHKRMSALLHWQDKQRQEGLCRNCDNVTAKGRHYCEDHLEFHQKQCQRMRTRQGELHG